MSWRDRLQRGSFSGVSFWTEDTAAVKGRRTPVRRVAGKDGSRNSDSGRNEDAFSVTAFLWGDDYDIERAELEDALLKGGAGALVLPTRGELWVRVVGDISTTETRREGGFCTIMFSVVTEDKDAGKLSSLLDTAGKLKSAASALRDAGGLDFDDVMSIAGMPGKALRKAVNAVQGVTQKLRNVQGKINGVLNPLGDLSAAIDDLDATASGLLNTPTALRNKIMNLVDSVYGLADTSRSTIDRTTGLRSITGSAYELSRSVRTTKNAGMGGLGADEPATGATPNDDRSAKNVRAIYRVARVAAIARQAETYADAPFDSATLAGEVLTSLRDEAGALQEYSAGDELFQALSDLRSAAASHLAQTAGALPRTIVHTPKEALPALRIARDLYGDARQEADIVARNRMEHPLFVSGDIEVLEP